MEYIKHKYRLCSFETEIAKPLHTIREKQNRKALPKTAKNENNGPSSV
jgi:hypothetical protein